MGFVVRFLLLFPRYFERATANREAAIIGNYLNFDRIFSFPSPSLQSLFAVTLSSVLGESSEPAGAWLPLLDAEALTLIYILVNCLHPLVSPSFSLLKMQLLLTSVNETHLKGIAPSLDPAWVNNPGKLPPAEGLQGGTSPLRCPAGPGSPGACHPLCWPSLTGPRAKGAERLRRLPRLSRPCTLNVLAGLAPEPGWEDGVQQREGTRLPGPFEAEER